jgi:hypothetical protein
MLVKKNGKKIKAKIFNIKKLEYDFINRFIKGYY